MGIHHLTFMRRNLENKKELMPVQIMDSACMNSTNIVSSIGIFGENATMNIVFSE